MKQPKLRRDREQEKFYESVPMDGEFDNTGRIMVSGVPDPYELDLRLDLRNHSPTGFAWGYSGSGPAQLALAILADACGDDERALACYQVFKAELIAQLGHGTWTFSAVCVMAWLASYEESQIERLQVQIH